MTDISYLLIALIVLGLIVWLAFRFGARLTRFPCPAWLAWTVETDNPFTGATRAASIINAAGLRPGMKVLDLGCGPGRVSVPAAQAVMPGGEVLAVDLQPGMLRRAEARAQSAHVTNIRFLQAAIGAGQLPMDQFDRAFLVTVLGEIPDRKPALAEIFRALKPGGILTIAETALDPHYQRRGFVIDLASSVGFRPADFHGAWYGYSLNLLKPPAA